MEENWRMKILCLQNVAFVASKKILSSLLDAFRPPPPREEGLLREQSHVDDEERAFPRGPPKNSSLLFFSNQTLIYLRFC